MDITADGEYEWCSTEMEGTKSETVTIMTAETGIIIYYFIVALIGFICKYYIQQYNLTSSFVFDIMIFLDVVVRYTCICVHVNM